MADNFDWLVSLRIRIDGASQANTELTKLTKTVADQEKAWEQSQKAEAKSAQQSKSTASAVKSTGSALDGQTKSTNSLRYANYDLASSLVAVSAAITAMGVGTVVAFAKVETGLAQVQRTTGTTTDEFAALTDQLIQMGDSLPVTTDEISKMAARGGQLGVANDQIADFTETLSKFVAISDTLSADEAAEAIARIGNLTGVDNWDALASSIALVGVNSAATDAQIVKTTQELAQAGAAANFSADELIGLAAAFASLGVPPERARSVIQDLISVMNKGLAGQNDALQQTAKILGTTTDAVAQLWQTDPAQFISSFASALNGVDNITVALSDVGLEGKRAQPVFAALAKDSANAGGGVSVLNQALADAQTGFQDQTEVNRQFAIIADTLGASWQTFLNTLLTTGAAIGAQFAPAVKDALTAVQGLLEGVRDFVSSDFGGFIVRVTATLASFVAVWAAIRGAIALATASGLAFKTATAFLGGGGIAKGILGMAAAWGFYTPAAEGAAKGTWKVGFAFKALGKALLIGAAIQLVISLFTDLGGTVDWVAQKISGLFGWLAEVTKGMPALANGAKQIQDFANGVSNWSKTLPRAASDTEDFDKALASLNSTYGEGEEDASDYTDALDNQAKTVRTLVDYANDLSTVWSRAFDIRFSGQSALDAITKTFQDLRDAAAETAANIRSLKADLQGLDSDINIQKQFLSVAVQYGDQTRAQAIQADIAKLEADRAKKLADLNKEQENNNRTLVGNSKAAVQNRSTILGLVQQYQAHVQALAASGLSTDDLKAATAQLEQDFITQASQLGYNVQELGIYTSAFRDVKVAIDNVPRNITVTFNADPALQALNEFAAQAVATAGSAGNSAGSSYGQAFTNAVESKFANFANAAASGRGIAFLTNALPNGTSSPAGSGFGGAFGVTLQTLLKKVFGFSGGGYTGSGGKYEPAGIVHKGEYVVPKHMVNQSTGLPYSDSLGRLQRGAPTRSGYAGGGYVRGGGLSGPVTLSAGTIQQLAMVMDKVISVDGRVVGDTASRSYANGTAVGRLSLIHI